MKSAMRLRFCLSVLAVLCAAGPTHAFIAKIYPFSQILQESTHVIEGKVEKVDRRARTATAVVARAMKGKSEYRLSLIHI